ncbi:aldehyde dehydrogenase family protein, partial [Halomonas denitrificans]|uniref:aldehyde dehydrogenase family protein n=1 Tax=Halomonas denitrificans TaxID=370769 RepID=UPI000DF205FD
MTEHHKFPRTRDDWQALAAELCGKRGLETRAYIDDAFVEARSGATLATVNPATGETLAEVASCDAADAEVAVAAARAAVDGGAWSRLA